MRRLANKRQRYLIFMVQNGLCAVCNRELPIDFEVDHQQPFSQKGKTELWNLQALCLTCHHAKTSSARDSKP